MHEDLSFIKWCCIACRVKLAAVSIAALVQSGLARSVVAANRASAEHILLAKTIALRRQRRQLCNSISRGLYRPTWLLPGMASESETHIALNRLAKLCRRSKTSGNWTPNSGKAQNIISQQKNLTGGGLEFKAANQCSDVLSQLRKSPDAHSE